MKKKALVVFGTRPEGIKMAPIVKALQKSEKLEAVTCSTGQHRQMLDQVLEFFQIKPDYDLNLMAANQTLVHITVECLLRLQKIFEEVRPAVVLVQGDTTTTMAAALAAFYARIPVGHVEAGLRTWRKDSPFPEEANRRMVSPLADFHFAPTQPALNNLLGEGLPAKDCYLTGNTSIDALLWAAKQKLEFPELEKLFGDRKLILLTAHRRESFGEPLRQVFTAIKTFCQRHPEYHVLYPVHLNPNVKGPADEILQGVTNMTLLPPVAYRELVFLMKRCELVLTDSGGIQEESPTLGKPVLVLRETTERPEAVTSGCARLVGQNPSLILDSLEELVKPNSELYRTMSQAKNPFGDGTAAEKTIRALEDRL